MLRVKHIRKVTKPIHSVYKNSPHIEHIGFVALAGTEVFHLGQLIFFVNVALLSFGALAVLLETFHFYEA